MSKNNFDLCKTLADLKKENCVVGATGKNFKDLHAASTENNLLTLHSLIIDFEAKDTLEIGLAYGASCLTMAAAHREIGSAPLKQHTAIDPFQSTTWDSVAKILIDKEKLTEYIDIYEQYSNIALPTLIEHGKKFDLIYVDGSHLFEDVFIDFYYSNRLLRKSGIIAFDDSSDKHVRKVLSFIDSNFADTYRKIDISRYRSGLDKLKYRAASMLQKNQLTVIRKLEKVNAPGMLDLKVFNGRFATLELIRKVS